MVTPVAIDTLFAALSFKTASFSFCKIKASTVVLFFLAKSLKVNTPAARSLRSACLSLTSSTENGSGCENSKVLVNISSLLGGKSPLAIAVAKAQLQI